MNAARVPFVGQLLAHLNRLQALVDPFAAVSLLEIGFQCAVNRQFRIDRFFYALPTDLRQPELERLGFGRGNGLNDAKELFRVGYIGVVAFPVCRTHFQLTTFCSQLTTFFFQSGLQHAPIFRRVALIRLIGQHSYNIDDGKVPFFLFCIPCGANALILK